MADPMLDLDNLLDLERQYLLTGALDHLTDISDRKLELVDELQANSHTLPDPIREKLHKNQDLLKSAIAGIQAAKSRMTEFRHVRDCLSFYGPPGHRQNISLSGARQLKTKA